MWQQNLLSQLSTSSLWLWQLSTIDYRSKVSSQHAVAAQHTRLCQLSQLSVSPSQLRRCWVGPAVAYLTT